MSHQCPFCGEELGPFINGMCPYCGQHLGPITVPAGPDPHAQLRRFHTTLFAMTPRTWGITAIVGANIFVFVAMLASGANIMNPGTARMLDWGANFGPYTLNGEPWRLLTCMFLHFGIIHIGFNMYVLWQIGHLVERLVGNIGFLLLYLASGVAASIASLAWNWNPPVVSAGASGAVFGVCGALLGFIVLRRDTIPGEVIRSLRSSLVTFVIYNVLFGMLIPAIDMAAHLGGFAYGFFCGLVLSLPVRLESVSRRWQRNVALLAGSAVLLTPAFFLIPNPAANPASLESRIRILDQSATERYIQLRDQWEHQKIKDDQFLQLLQQQVEEPWRTALSLNHLLFAATGQRRGSKADAIGKYLNGRLVLLDTLIEGVRQHDKKLLGKHTLFWQQLDQQQRRLFQPD